MDWVKPFYEQTGRWWRPTGVSDLHRSRAAIVERLGKLGRKRTLDLGTGAGGTAAAMADCGNDVTAIELAPTRAVHARALAETRSGLTVLEGDFYTAEFHGPFDVVCYWDGFGIGSDEDQRRLLRRIAADWLAAQLGLRLEKYDELGTERKHMDAETRPGARGSRARRKQR